MLGLLWNLAHSEDVPTDIMDQALTAHIKILDYSCSQVKNDISFCTRKERKQIFLFDEKSWLDRICKTH